MKFLLLALLFVSPLSVGGTFTGEKIFSHQGLQRTYWLHVPTDLKPDAPLIVVIHGYTGAAKYIMDYSKMNDIADREGFVVVYPQGTVDSQGNTFFNVGYDFHRDSPVDDLSFIRQLTLDVSQRYDSNPSKIFATGMSNGGDMSYMLACTSTDIFRAVAPITGVLMKDIADSCDTSKAIPLFEIHGTADDISPFEGDMDNSDGYGAYYDLPSSTQFFVNAMGLSEKTLTSLEDKDPNDGSSITFERYYRKDNNQQVWFYIIEDGGHHWPGAQIPWWQYPIDWFRARSSNRDINASEEVWSFFSEYL
jgi:polyhydroxybutyrate depolymerase